MLKRNAFDLILMDVFMPVMNGAKALQKIREFEKENQIDKKTPVIIVTGNFTKFDRIRTQKIDCDDFLSKPLDKDILIQSIKRVTSKANSGKVLVIEDDESQAFVL